MNKEMLDLYTDYLISQNGQATATGLSAAVDGAVSHDQVTRSLSCEECGSKELWEYVKPTVRKIETDEGVLELDDTCNEKPHTDENEIVCWHYDHSKNRHVKGINILSSLVRYDDIALPIGYELVKKDIRYQDEKTGRERRKASVSKNEYFKQLVCQAVKNSVKFKYVLADSWYGTSGNMNLIRHDLHKHFIFATKSNRHAALSRAAQKQEQFQEVQALDWNEEACKTVYLKGLTFPVQLLKKVFKNKDGSTGTLYLVTNDLTLDADVLYEVYKKRWRIEEFHKSVKQNASLSKSPTRVERTQKNHIFAAVIAYCKLEFLKMKTALNHFALKYKLIVRANQVTLRALRDLAAATG
jgi:DNA-directed RNA polymerase subunit RPC12/RpoP